MFLTQQRSGQDGETSTYQHYCIEINMDTNVGDLVRLKDCHVQHNEWPMALVMKTFPGNDGIHTANTSAGTSPLGKFHLTNTIFAK